MEGVSQGPPGEVWWMAWGNLRTEEGVASSIQLGDRKRSEIAGCCNGLDWGLQDLRNINWDGKPLDLINL